ncbi:MAG TPA: protein kinase, partial [Vicinamibacterales bacterium]|nr:protein kinase [Vicinamibacterales bacterium]
ERIAQLTHATPARWGPFEIVEEIGRGAFGTVYRARDPRLQREVALKIVRRPDGEAEAEADRALAEARSLAKIDHANVVRVYQVERIGQEIGMAMELVRGLPLSAIVEQQAPYGAAEAALIGRDLCRALAAVHAVDTLHGDVKAHNVVREQGGRLVLMDFGTGRDLTVPRGDGQDFAGTPAYLAPEVFAGRPRSKQSDIYSLGVLLYYLVSGRYPVDGDTRTDIQKKHREAAPPKPLRDVRPDLPDAFIRVVERALKPDPEDRHASVGAFEAALGEAIAAPPQARSAWKRPRALALLGTAVVAVAIAALLLTRRPIAETAAERPAPVPAAVPDGYRIAAMLFDDSGPQAVRLQPGGRITPGQTLSLRVRSSVPVYVYVINEDDTGEAYLLFPLPGQVIRNPLPPGEFNRLPGSENGERLSWQVTTSGRREHFIIAASPQPTPMLEELIERIPAPALGRPVRNHRLPGSAASLLRSVGGLVAAPAATDRRLRDDPTFATPLTDGEEEVQGVWIRRLTLDNPPS